MELFCGDFGGRDSNQNYLQLHKSVNMDNYAKHGQQEGSDFYVIFTMIRCSANFCVR